VKVLLIDDHPLFRAGFHAILSLHLPEGAVLSAASLAEAEGLLSQDDQIVLVLLDVHLQGADGFAGLRAIRARFPTVACVMISGDEHEELAARAIALGASGFIPKSLTVQETVAAIGRVLDGEIFVPRRTTVPSLRETPTLTLRQLEVINMLGQGLANKEIAQLLNVAERTVKAHISALFEALSVRNRTEAVLVAQRYGFLSRAPAQDSSSS
jgi:two-component system, NarL family, nitrate/nitrite response regulator NarL